MEAMGAEGQWTSLSGVYTAEEADFMALLLNNQLSSVNATSQYNFWPPHHHHHHHHHDHQSTILMNNMNNNYCSLELSSASASTYSSTDANSFINAFPTSNDHLSSDNINTVSQPITTHSFDFFLAGDSKSANHDSSYLVQGDHQQRRGDDDDHLSSEENGSGGEAFPAPRDIKIETSAKRRRSFEKVDHQVGKKFGKSKKKPKIATTSKTLGDHQNEEEGGNNNNNGNLGANNGHCSSSTTCCSGDESINDQLGQETSTTGGDASSLSRKEPNSDSKARARRGSATDPQSLYARKRRERINERLKVLQNLVPNGTKVDISTMLEEAVLYVKFLQLQIKLLSSDELWMYAPIAYNGKDIGLDHLKLSLAK